MSALDDQTILRKTATRVLDTHGLVLEDVEIRGGGAMPQVRLIVDLPEDQLGSVDLETVAEASRELSELVDADDALLGSAPVLLEVTTPGVERVLSAPRHFRRSRGRIVSLSTADGTTYRARMLALEGDLLLLRQEPGRDDRGRPLKLPEGTVERLRIPLSEVTTAKVEIEFDPPADLAQLIADAETAATDTAAADTAATDHTAEMKES
ncbi:ribosome maturation factor RimP [Brachybacterium sp. AOP42-C2-15]|uniref:ribosome maturation factor RimP n=1 Tax=unclassified Brachybacterium TaxID=2623841 RepID=UPI003F8F7C9A